MRQQIQVELQVTFERANAVLALSSRDDSQSLERMRRPRVTP